MVPPPPASSPQAAPHAWETDEAFRLLVESVKDHAVFMLDPEGRVRTWNPGAERLKGWRAEEIVGHSHATFYPPEAVQAGRPRELLRTAERDGRVVDEGWRVRKDGTRFQARVVITALRDGEGRLLGFGKVTSDLSESLTRVERELQAERSLRESQETFRLLVESVKDYAIFMLDPQGHVVTWNAGAERLKGWSAREVVGRHFSSFYPEEDVRAGKPESELVRAAREGRVEDQGWRMRKDGTRFYARVVISALRDASGALRGFAKVTNDTTESWLATERVLRVLNEAGALLETPDHRTRLRRVAQLAVPALADWCVVDLRDGEALERVAAVHADPDQAQLMAEVERLPPDSGAGRGIPLVVDSGLPLVVPDARDMSQVSWSDPAYLDLLRRLGLQSFACMPLTVRGRAAGAITFCSTLAARYQQGDLVWLQAFARVAASALENATLFKEVEEAAQAAQRAVAMRDVFLSVASHELRTPLNTLQLQVQAFLRAARKTGDPRSQERLDRLAAQTRRLAELVSTLLDVSRLRNDRPILEPVELDLCELVREVVARDAELAQSAGCALEVELPGPTRGRWDRMRLEQALTNLLGNAIKFGAGRPVGVKLEARGERVRLSVTDHGVGIAPEDQARIFERFERAVSAHSFGGLGLGLWIVSQNVRAHGGTVEVHSAPGQGARFTVELPRDVPAQEVPQ